MPPQSGPPLDVGSSAPQAPHGFANELAQLEDYHAQRASELKAKYGETPPDMVGVAMPVDVRGFSPFVTAEQQRLIDSVTDKYIGRTDLAGLMEELRSLGVHPHQIAQNAEHYTAPGGIVVDRAGRQVKRLDVMI